MKRRTATPTGKYDDLGDAVEANRARLDGEQPIPFDEGERDDADRVRRARGGKPRGKPGPAPDPDSLTAQREDGRASHLHAVIPAELHQRLKVRSVMTGETVSAMVAEACAEYLERRSGSGGKG